MFSDLGAYERLVYTLSERFPSICRSTLVVVRHGVTIAEVRGEIEFGRGIVLGVWEDVNSARNVIQAYGYWVQCEGRPLYWYDPQPHPHDPLLVATFPHHKHIPPDIKHNRVPAPGISFVQPNLPFLIREIEQTLLK